MKSKTNGFTLIELMIVIAIIAILISLALPAYLEYSIRSKNSECLTAAIGAKIAVAETFQSTGALPSTNLDAGYSFDSSKYCSSIIISENGEITATTSTHSGVVFTIRPTPNTGRIDWVCTANTDAKIAYIPATCRTP